MTRRVLPALLLLAGCAAEPVPAPAARGSGAYDGPMNRVLLKDWRPKSSLVVPETQVPRAKFGAIDAHLHPGKGTPDEAAAWVRIMDEVNLEGMVLMTGATGAEFDRLADAYGAHPGRFLLLCGLDFRAAPLDDPAFPEKVVTELERCRRKGALGVGEITDWGNGVDDASKRPGGRLHIDDPRLDPVWRKCAELKMPVNVHIADHISAWEPDDRHQERMPALQRYSRYGLDIPPHAEMIARFLALVGRHPGTTFVAKQLCNIGHDLAQLGRALDRLPNLYVDTGSRLYELGRQPFSGPKFVATYRDRVLFGTDEVASAKVYRKWFRFLETRDEYLPSSTGWRNYGQGLSDDLLRAVYRDNARRVYPWPEGR